MKRDVQGQTELRVKVSELCGWTVEQSNQNIDFPYFLAKDGVRRSVNWRTASGAWSHGLPDYPNDLNACHEFEMAMTDEQRVRFRLCLMFNSDGRKATFPTVEAALCHATAEQRCRAFVATMGAPSVPAGNENHLAPPGSPKTSGQMTQI